jgi:hypothetical protein
MAHLAGNKQDATRDLQGNDAEISVANQTLETIVPKTNLTVYQDRIIRHRIGERTP